jgi:hypothetical protein
VPATDGRRFLYLATFVGAKSVVRLGSLDADSAGADILADADGPAAYASGHLLFDRGGLLMAQPFDPSAGRLSGAATGEDKALSLGEPPQFVSPVDTSPDGTLARASNGHRYT